MTKMILILTLIIFHVEFGILNINDEKFSIVMRLWELKHEIFWMYFRKLLKNVIVCVLNVSDCN
jgi:hypothetical protein